MPHKGQRKYSEQPWQSCTQSSKERLNALFTNGSFTDVTITFPGHSTSYEAHRVVLAMTSPVFEGLLFGPMGSTGETLELYEEDPEAFRHVLAYCYETSLVPKTLEEALLAFVAADRYLIENLKIQCSQYIESLIDYDNFLSALEFVDNFDLVDLRSACAKAFNSLFYKEGNVEKFPMFLLSLETEWITELLRVEAFIELNSLVFQESWRNPSTTLPDESLLAILGSSSCKRLQNISGCISGQVVKRMGWGSVTRPSNLNISLCSSHHILDVTTTLGRYYGLNRLSLHIPLSKVIPDDLKPLPMGRDAPTLFLSEVSECNIDSVVNIVSSLMPEQAKFIRDIKLPRCKLGTKGYRSLAAKLIGRGVRYKHMWISSLIIKEHQDALVEWNKTNKRKGGLTGKEIIYQIMFVQSDEKLDGW